MNAAARAIVACSIAFVTAGAAVTATEACDTCFIARYWRVAPDTPFTFPETQALAKRKGLKDFGIALSGGGVRSAAASAGQLRGLEQNGWLSSAKYLTAVSGGAWTAVPFVFSKDDTASLLGPFKRPCDVTEQAFGEPPEGAIPRAIAAANLVPGGIREGILTSLQEQDPKIHTAVVDRFAWAKDYYTQIRSQIEQRVFPKGTRRDKTYGRMIGQFFLDPLIEPCLTLDGKACNPKASARTFTWSAGQLADDSMAQHGHGFPADMLTANAERPFLVVGATVVVPGDGDAYPHLAPVEFTPMYSGSRVALDGSGPGTYVSSWAYDAPEASMTGDGLTVQLDRSQPFTLADVIAATGSAPELTFLLAGNVPDALKKYERKLAAFFPSFAPLQWSEDGEAAAGAALSHGDGGFTDNLGLMPLLARGVGNVLVFFNTNTPFSQQNDDLKSLFMPVDTPGAGGDKTHNQVFDPAEYDPLYTALLKARGKGEPQFYCTQGLHVRANATYGIREYPKSGLNLCIFYNADVPTRWQKELPKSVQGWFDSTQVTTRGLETFPSYPTQNLNLKDAQVNLLGNLWSWIVTRRETVDEITRTLGLPAPARGVVPCPVPE